MSSDLDDGPFDLAFIGYVDDATPAEATAITAYEDEVLALLSDHGVRVLYRGHCAMGEDDELPIEVQLPWSPNSGSLESHPADDRRWAAMDRFGEVFTGRQDVKLDTLVGPDL